MELEPSDDFAAVANAIENCAVHLKYLGVGNAGPTMGAVEFLAVQIKEGLERVADAISDHGAAVERGLDSVAASLGRIPEVLETNLGDDEGLATEIYKFRQMELPQIIALMHDLVSAKAEKPRR
jgi:hypothetical protein